MPDWKNKLYYGDNLDVLQRYVADESVDLVYLDPPFNSRQEYSVLFTENDGTRSDSQIRAFEDTWGWNLEAESVCKELTLRTDALGGAMRAFRAFLGKSNMMAYLAMMAPRLVELRRVMKPAASIYLHCDPTASHYLKLLMDGIFGPHNFRNEIYWYYYNKMHDSRKRLFPRANDTLLFYVKDVKSDFTFFQLKEFRDKPFKQLVRKKQDGRMINARSEDGKLMYRVKEDRTIDNVWRIPMLQPASPERMGYPTQKPEALLERILKASSKEGDVVLDPFCGCGTTVQVAQSLNRRWIGVDITHLAINLIKKRLSDSFGETVRDTYEVIGEPTDLAGARELANEKDKYQFQSWALGLCGARPVDLKKGADRGIDGRLYFHDEKNGKPKQIVFSVKSGHVTPGQVRDLRGTIEREDAEIGVFLCMEKPTKPMQKEAAEGGFYNSPAGFKYPRVQILTVEGLMSGKERLEYPRLLDTTFKQAPRAKGQLASQEDLPLV